MPLVTLLRIDPHKTISVKKKCAQIKQGSIISIVTTVEPMVCLLSPKPENIVYNTHPSFSELQDNIA